VEPGAALSLESALSVRTLYLPVRYWLWETSFPATVLDLETQLPPATALNLVGLAFVSDHIVS
jgi:hypothetical protein